MGIHISTQQFIHLLPLFAPVIILQLILIITSLISIMKKGASLEKTILWLIISLAITIIGPVIYFTVGSKQLDRDASQRKEH